MRSAMSQGHGQSTIKTAWQRQNAAGSEVFPHLSSQGAPGSLAFPNTSVGARVPQIKNGSESEPAL